MGVATGHEDQHLFTALADAAEWRMRDFNSQNLANTAWAFATGHEDQHLFTALADAAERRMRNFKSQELASTAWVLAAASMGHKGERLFTA